MSGISKCFVWCALLGAIGLFNGPRRLTAEEPAKGTAKLRTRLFARVPFFKTEFDDDSEIPVMTRLRDLKGRLLIRVNGSPVRLCNRSDIDIGLDEWLVPGENTVTVEGSCKRAAYVKIVMIPKGEVLETHTIIEKILAKCWIKLDGVTTVKFRSDGHEDPVFERLGEDPASSERNERELRHKIEQMAKAWEKHDGDGFAKALCGYPDSLDDFPEDSIFRSEIEEHCEWYIRHVGKTSLGFKSIASLMNLKLVHGTRSVYAYAGGDGDEINPFLFKYEKSLEKSVDPKFPLGPGASHTIPLEPLVFVRINGNWLPWFGRR